MDDLLDLHNIFSYWRMLLLTALSVLLATVLANVIAGFPAAAWVATVCAGTALGVLWHWRSRRP